MRQHRRFKSGAGFTLIEIIVVLIILGVVVALVIPRLLNLTEEKPQKGIDAAVALTEVKAKSGIDAAIAELNGREAMTWAKEKLKAGGWTGDATVFNNLNTDLGADYNWTAGPDVAGGTIDFKGTKQSLVRNASQDNNPAKWQ